MSVARIKDLPSPENLQGVPEIKEYLERLHAALQEEQSERIEDFDQLKLDNVPYVDVRTYGLIAGDNSSTVMTKNVAGWNTLIAAVDAGTEIYFPTGVWYINDDLDVSQEVTMRGDGAGSKIQQTTNSKNIIDVNSSNVTINKLNILGTGQASTGGTAIDVSGADANNYLNNIKIIDCKISACNAGIVTRWIEQFEFKGNVIIDLFHFGMLIFYSQDGEIHHNHIEDLDRSESYGITITRSAGTLATYPTSKRIDVHNNIIKDVINWNGLDTHAGEKINFYDNQIILCKRGISVGGDADTPDHEPIDISVIGNTIDSDTITDTARFSAIIFVGTSNGAATGVIANNTIRGHGDADSDISGAIIVATTQGLVISGNTFIEPSPRAIILSSDNQGFVITGNTIIDPYTDAAGVGEAIGIKSDITNNVGYIGNNSFIRGTKSATYVLDSAGTGKAIRIDDSAGTDIVIGTNYSEADTYLLDPGSKTSTINHDDLTGFVTNEHIDWTNTSNNLRTLGSIATSEIKIDDDQIWDNSDNEGGALGINYNGKDGGTTQFKNFAIYDGKNNLIARFIGSDKGVHMPSIKSGTTQGGAGAAEGELWVDTDDDNTVKLGAST